MVKQRSLLMYILLSVVTCGLYSIYFWYCFTEDVNKVCEGDNEASPNYIIVMLLSIVTCGIYGLYWMYKQANRLKTASGRYGVLVTEGGSEFLLWYLVGALLCFIGSFIGLNVLFKNMNVVGHAYNDRYGYYGNGGGNGGGMNGGGMNNGGMNNSGMNSNGMNSGSGNGYNGGVNHGMNGGSGNGYNDGNAGSVRQESAPRFCKHCGTPLNPADRFCKACGTPVTGQAQGTQAQANSFQGAGTQESDLGQSVKNAAGEAVENLKESFKSGKVSLQMIAALVAIVKVVTLVFDGLFVTHAGFFNMYAMIEYVLPFLFLAVFAVFGLGVVKEAEKYALLPMVGFLLMEILSYLGISTSSMMIGNGFYGGAFSAWHFMSAGDKFFRILICLALLAMIVVIVLDMVEVLRDKRIVLVTAVCVVGLVAIWTVVTFFRTTFGAWGIGFDLRYFFRGVGQVLGYAPLLLFVLGENMDTIKDLFHKK